MATCKRKHRYNPIFEHLDFSEEWFGLDTRFHCSGCAYNQGWDDGINGRPNNPNLVILDTSQAGYVRHTNPVQAYNWGYTDATTGVARRSF
jgi:hypothetical protein